MTLPGKITIALLEEDIPQKTFFRLKPLFLETETGFEDATDIIEAFPDEGGIRIVPDRNEAVRFKNRMRATGRYCMLNLKKHTGENDKIRPNKNYSPENGEINRNIVYSDAVAACPEGCILEVIKAQKNGETISAKTLVPIGTRFAALEIEDEITGPYRYEMGQEEEETLFFPAEGFSSFHYQKSALTNLHSYKLNDTEITVMLKSDMTPFYGMLTPEKPAAEPKTDSPAAQEAPQIPENTEKAPEEPPIPADEPIAEPIPVKTKEAKPAPVKPVQPEIRPIETHSSSKASARSSFPDKRGPQLPRPESTGLNPRRGKCLSEIIDEGWRKSRLDVLGTPVPGEAMGKPVISPVERAMNALKDAWNLTDARKDLTEELKKLDGLTDCFAPESVKGNCPAWDRTEFDDLEAERLKLLSEIDEMRLRKMEKREELMQEIRQIHQKEIDDLTGKVSCLKKEEEACRKSAESAMHAREEASRLFNKDSRKALEGEFLRFALNTRAAEIIRDGGDTEDMTLDIPRTYEPNAAQLVSDVRREFEASGRALSHEDAVTLLCALASGSMLILNGAPGSGKTDLARSLAGALGLTSPASPRFIALGSETKEARSSKPFLALTRYEDNRSLKMVLLDDVNASPADQTKGLLTYSESKTCGTIKLLLTMQDSGFGYPAEPRLLDRAFFLRLENAPVRGRVRILPAPCAPQTPLLESFKKAFDPMGSVPREIENRLDRLLDALEKEGLSISRRALGEIYGFCACAMPISGRKPSELLDQALSMRAMPYLMAVCPFGKLKKLPELFCDMPKCLRLLNCPLPVCEE